MKNTDCRSDVMRAVAFAACFAAVLSLAPAARAGFEEGIQAMERQDYETALAEIRPVAEGGSPAAQFVLGLIYDRGYVGQSDPLQAIVWYRRALAQGTDQAVAAMAQMIAEGRGLGERADELVALYEAAEGGQVDAQLYIARSYDDGIDMPVNRGEAARWYAAAARGGDAEAMVRLGQLLATGDGVEADPAGAVGLFRSAADAGSAEGQFWLGTAYGTGIGVERDDARALEWFEMAAMQGHAPAMYSLGVMYDQGRGTRADRIAAVEWFTMAAREGDARAQLTLGDAYAAGNGVPQDMAQAAEWWKRAAEQDQPWAQYRLAIAYQEGEGVTKNWAEALRWYEPAAHAGIPDARYRLALIHINGSGGNPQDFVRAWVFLRLAEEQGHEHAASARRRLENRMDKNAVGDAQELLQKVLEYETLEIPPPVS
jgi:TPR repeat protein